MAKNDGLIIFSIFLSIIGIIVAVSIPISIQQGTFDKPLISIIGYLTGSDLLTQYQSSLGLQFRNDGKANGLAVIKISSDNKNVSFNEESMSRIIPITKDSFDKVDMLFNINKSSFNNNLGNFTIFLDISYDNRNFDRITWRYYEDCPYGKYQSCYYKMIK